MVQNLARDFGSVDRCQDAEPASAMNTSQNLSREQTFHQFRPGIVPMSPMPLREVSRRLRFAEIRGVRAARSCGDCGGVGGARREFRGWVIGDDRWSPFCRRTQQPVKPNQLRAWRGH